MEYSTTNVKADKFTFPVVEVLTIDIDRFSEEMLARINQAPAFFLNAPLVLDLTHVADNASSFLDTAVGFLRANGMNPLGIRGGPLDIAEKVDELGLAVLPEERKPRKIKPVAKTAIVPLNEQVDVFQKDNDETPVIAQEKPIEEPVSVVRNIFHTRTVRSGQKLSAMDGDLTVVASAGAGSELIAAGNIHVYGALRGRAIAGVGGNKSCRIFCHKLDAELISIAGTYRLSEDLDDKFRHQPVQIFLEGEQLKVQLLSEIP